ncbi:MAG TPA: tripartite tricarboxylate transporter substrate binding protein [Casimicrobiaceae bacterium]|jgi:tripartite-type tricarboxylate transporter receptor subunit TctC|nr:tripartite tricarboxylate transporter substrate binding protein [Casimicrobiaceae bacterium]
MKRFLSLLLSSLLLVVAAASALAQGNYPDRPVRIIVPFPAGGPADALARIVGERLAQSLGKPFVIENKAGAGGNIGMEQGARAAPDGYTLTLAPVGNLTVAPALYAKLPYDPVKDFAPITVLAVVPNVLIVHPSVPAKTVAELVALAKAKPGSLNYASPGNGSIPHLAAELFKRVAGVDVVHVPFNGVAPATNAVLSGEVQMFFAQSSSALPQWRAGKVVALGVATRKRLASAPELPTIAEQGFPDFEATSWYGLVAPAGTPSSIVERLHGEIVRALALPEVRERIAGLGAETVGNSPSEFAAMQKAEAARWIKIAREANIHAD